ncbi:MAG: Lrp/AsnC family transcriptional regulator, partial [Gammaproteobacteria bacterium]|nr:Lrp/AsnC family transcriptional regulator [Gammaproteobacteria bacterium]
VIRRIGLVPNHYTLGYKANGMTVWDLPDEKIGELGEKIGSLDYVSHCYQRPRHQPLWNYNLFAMVHGRDRSEVSEKVEQIAKLLGDNDRGHEILYSSRILKKTGLRI